MIVRVRMLAFEELLPDGAPVIREVDVPDAEITGSVLLDLDAVYYYGQNDFQPRECCSVSVGDVAEYAAKLWYCGRSGWLEMPEGEYVQYTAMDRRERLFSRSPSYE